MKASRSLELLAFKVFKGFFYVISWDKRSDEISRLRVKNELLEKLVQKGQGHSTSLDWTPT